jgi:serine/threonine protein phosphatase PrpC
MGLTVQAAGCTDLGMVRKNNEDNFGYDTRLGLFIVCDGMGGAAAGEVASKLGVDTVITYFREARRHHHYPVVGETFEGVSERANALASAIQLANQAIHEMGTKSEGKRGMGSTIVAAMIKGNYLSIAHVGDSRIYLVRQGNIQQLTNDHSLVMEQVRRGLITREQAERSEMQNIIIRALGSEESVKPDVEDLVVLPGDLLLLCTDGLTKHVKDDWILGILMEAPDLEHACRDLIDAANSHGGDDNITCVLVKVVQVPWYRKMFHFFGGNHRWRSST